MSEDWPQPYRLLDAEPYWAALDEERLTFQRCDSCGEVVWPAHSYCPHCSFRGLRWEESGGRGTVWSFSTVMRGPTPVWTAIVPYTVGFVELAEGYRLFGQIEADPAVVEIGMPVEVRFVRRGAQTLPVFAPTSGG
ncbi:Zn-ribbon domain-containing OB-fold protein [Amycolatopsis thermophila]|uniref:OB-fold protein n=1 Tax=Amycolatopsis thermophila TaxID=206084 RepID=A0ABU0F558_9PSEU|nr:Zn-ribbon domain-containing OB-fold protein [Amycolatopsis thermophila]MDQ0382479.1 putative OB-fold protein [Amycolatopsis thermophila]